jgi:hypothetical protein
MTRQYPLTKLHLPKGFPETHWFAQVEMSGLEPLASSVQGRRSPS